jgi:hypothetical protein
MTMTKMIFYKYFFFKKYRIYIIITFNFLVFLAHAFYNKNKIAATDFTIKNWQKKKKRVPWKKTFIEVSDAIRV